MKAFVKSSAKPAFLSVSGDHPTIRAGRGGREEDGEEGRGDGPSVGTWSLGGDLLVPPY
jgi:hypothetical protein